MLEVMFNEFEVTLFTTGSGPVNLPSLGWQCMGDMWSTVKTYWQPNFHALYNRLYILQRVQIKVYFPICFPRRKWNWRPFTKRGFVKTAFYDNHSHASAPSDLMLVIYFKSCSCCHSICTFTSGVSRRFSFFLTSLFLSLSLTSFPVNQFVLCRPILQGAVSIFAVS